MSFLTEYFDEFRPMRIRKVKPCLPEDRQFHFEGTWMDPKQDTEEIHWTDEERREFIKKTTKAMRGQSTYYNDYCAHLDPIFKTREFVPKIKKPVCKRPGKTEPTAAEEGLHDEGGKLALKDTEVMKIARDLYERDLDEPTLKPLETHARILGYVRPRDYKTGLTDYQHGIARLAYELVRDDRIPKYVAHNGARPKWGYPPEGVRQPELEAVPFDGERLY